MHAATIHTTNIQDTRQAMKRKQHFNNVPQLQGKRHNRSQARTRTTFHHNKATRRQTPRQQQPTPSPSVPSTGVGPEAPPSHSYTLSQSSNQRTEIQSRKRKGDQTVNTSGEDRTVMRSRPHNSQPSSSSQGQARKRPHCQGPSSYLLAKLAAKFPKLNPPTSTPKTGDG